MADIKAYAINQIKHGEKNIPASTKERPSIFSIDKESFDRLEKLNAVRAPTKDEAALFKVQQEALGNGEEVSTASSDDLQEDASRSSTARAPASGATGDPKGKPKGAADKEDLGV